MYPTYDERTLKRESSETMPSPMPEPLDIGYETGAYNYYFIPASSVISYEGECYLTEYVVGAEQYHIPLELYDLKSVPCNYPSPSHPRSTAISDLSLLLERLSALDPSTDVSSLKDFLYRKEYIAYTLVEAHSRIIEIFGSTVKDIKIKIIHDPEEDYSGVAVSIFTDINPEEALSLLRKFDDEWWLDVSPGTRKLITIDVEL